MMMKIMTMKASRGWDACFWPRVGRRVSSSLLLKLRLRSSVCGILLPLYGGGVFVCNGDCIFVCKCNDDCLSVCVCMCDSRRGISLTSARRANVRHLGRHVLCRNPANGLATSLQTIPISTAHNSLLFPLRNLPAPGTEKSFCRPAPPRPAAAPTERPSWSGRRTGSAQTRAQRRLARYSAGGFWGLGRLFS